MREPTGNLAYFARGPRTYGVRPIFRRARGYWEFQWILRGSARQDRADDSATTQAVSAPCLYISHPDSPHGWTDEGENISEIFVLHFRSVPGELSDQINPTKTLIFPLGEREHRQQLARLDELWEMIRAGDHRQPLKLNQILIEIALLILGKSVPVSIKVRPLDRVEQALHWFEENIGENPSAKTVAEAIGVSPAHLRRLFAEAGRASPRAELTRLRIAATQHCLLEGWKQERIAGYFGFSEASAFSRAFTAACGLSPRRWATRERTKAAKSKPAVA